MSLSIARSLVCALILGSFFASLPVGRAQSAAVALTIVKPAGAPAGDPSSYHFRPEEADSGQDISHVFVLENDTAQTIRIVRVDASCSCTTAVLQPGSSEEGVDSGDVVLAPGQQIDLKVTVSIADAIGDIEKTVWVRVAGQTDPAATLHVTGTIDPPVMFVPNALDFGTGPEGHARALIFQVGFSPRAFPANEQPFLVPPAPYIKIRPAPGGSNRPGSFPPTYRVYRYAATLDSKAPAGPIDGAITFSQASATPPPASLPPASLPLQGTVAGDLSARPSTCIFGTVAAGASASVQMSVSSASRQNLAGIKITGDRPWLSAKVIGPAGASGTWSIRVIIAANAPAGAQNAHMIVTAPYRARLVIPVMAYIVDEQP